MLILKCRLLRNPRNKIKKISVFKNYVSQLRISLVTTGSDAVKHLLLFFKRLSDEIGSRSHTCLCSIKILNYVSEFLLKSEHFFSVKKTKNLFYFLGTWPLYTFEKGVRGMQIGILNSMRAHQYTRTIPLNSFVPILFEICTKGIMLPKYCVIYLEDLMGRT